MGKGAVKADGENFEGQCSTHGQPLSKSGADYAATVRNLGGDPENPWQIFPEAKKLYDDRREELRKIVANRRREYNEWAEANPALALELKGYLEGVLPNIDYTAIIHKANTSTRQASADVLGVLADTRLYPRRLQRSLPAGRCGRAYNGGNHERHSPPRRRDMRLRHILRILRLHEASRAPRLAHGAARKIHLDA